MARRVRIPRVLALTVAVASLATGVAAGGSPAAAQGAKAQRVQAQIVSAHRELRQLESQAEAASERYDAARIKLSSAQQAAAAAQSRLGAAQHRVLAMQASATAFAVAAYRGGESTSLMTVVGGSTGQLVGRVSALQAVSVSESQTLARVDAARRGEEQAQADATAALAAQRTATATMAANRDQILSAASKERTILHQLQVKEAAIIKAAKARAARRAAQRAAARLQAKQAAARAAARQLAKQPVTPPAPKPAPPPAPTPPAHHTPTHHAPPAGGASTAVAWAYREIGKPYVWGAAGPNSFDCSGLTQYVWGKAGVSLEHFTGDQWNEGTHVSRADLQPGDLVFFAYNTSEPSTIHHVGIYVGGGDMIDAPYTGVDVRKESAFETGYIGAVRPTG